MMILGDTTLSFLDTKLSIFISALLSFFTSETKHRTLLLISPAQEINAKSS